MECLENGFYFPGGFGMMGFGMFIFIAITIAIVVGVVLLVA